MPVRAFFDQGRRRCRAGHSLGPDRIAPPDPVGRRPEAFVAATARVGWLARLPRRLLRLTASLLEDRLLPWTLGNVALLLVIGALVLGIDVAFYAALIAVPLLLLALAMLAMTGGEDPDAVADGQH